MYLDQIVGGYIRFDVSDVVSSHFYDQTKERDLTYSELESLENHFTDSGTGSLYLKRIWLGEELQDVIILIGYDDAIADITLNFPAEQFGDLEQNEPREALGKLAMHVARLCSRCGIDEAVIGYEPAVDDDMKILEIKSSWKKG